MVYRSCPTRRRSCWGDYNASNRTYFGLHRRISYFGFLEGVVGMNNETIVVVIFMIGIFIFGLSVGYFYAKIDDAKELLG